MSKELVDPKWFREVLGQYPTGVCVITGVQEDGQPVGMTVGSFTSVSLDPPLVQFLPTRSSVSWQNIAGSGRFCVNILAAQQEDICRTFSSRLSNKFERIQYDVSPRGLPIIHGCVAWIDCDIHSVLEAGDHLIVLGLVHEMQIETADLPLLFFRGGYGRFWPHSLAVPDPSDLMADQLRKVDLARPEMEELAADHGARCIATIRTQGDVLIAASAGNPQRGFVATLVGQRLPDMPPTGSVFAAWLEEKEIDRWLRQSLTLEKLDESKASLRTVRVRGYSIGFLSEAQRRIDSILTALAAGKRRTGPTDIRDLTQHLLYDPLELTAEMLCNVFWISAPVFGPSGEVVLALTLYELPSFGDAAVVERCIQSLLATAAHVTRKLSRIRE